MRRILLELVYVRDCLQYNVQCVHFAWESAAEKLERQAPDLRARVRIPIIVTEVNERALNLSALANELKRKANVALLLLASHFFYPEHGLEVCKLFLLLL